MTRGKAQKSLQLIRKCEEILALIQPASVRAVCYQLFSQGWIESMAKKETNKVSAQLVYAREEGLIPWSWIVDETRHPERLLVWNDIDECVERVKESYRRDYWLEQETHVEVWSEKGTVRGTLKPVLDEYQVTFRAMHGYSSATEMHNAALQAQDHGPLRGLSFPAHTKSQDPRYRWFVEQYGPTCWELDAMNPNDLRARVEEAIFDYIDVEAWEAMQRVERVECQSLQEILGRWQEASSKSRQASKYVRTPADVVASELYYSS
jgi:hypothetical protein